ncbi:MAG: pseudaminic acid synthase [Fimbriimonadaceae bacterium]|jgi:N-acetylneuraminate synthase|nr:pseudaminic acid synthase [Fimbriimonadaceae bacterium]
MSKPSITINGRVIGTGHPTYIIAEMSANHNRDIEEALRLIHVAKEVGADAIKLQTYTPDTITIDCRNEHFQVKQGTIWEGKNLHDLYAEAYTPWEWHPKLFECARRLDLDCFSTPFDPTSVDFLEKLGPPVYKIASFELIDIPLIRRVAQTGRPMIMSTGMATFEEIQDAVGSARESGAKQIALLKCNSGYPAPPEEMNLTTIPDLSHQFNVPVGLSDHTLEMAVPVAAVALGACILEKHLTSSRSVPGPDSQFSLEPHEFQATVEAVRTTERALGTPSYGPTEREAASRAFRKSLFVVENMKAGEAFTAENVRSIRPGAGLPPKHMDEILGKRAARDLERGTPLSWDLVAD